RLAEFARSYARKNRHHEKPAPGDLVVPHHGIAVVACVAYAAEPRKHRVGRHRPIEDLACRVVARTFFGEDRESRVHDLHDIVGTGRKAVVRRIPESSRALWPLKSFPEAIEAIE